VVYVYISEWIVGGVCERMRIDENFNSTYHLTAWTLAVCAVAFILPSRISVICMVPVVATLSWTTSRVNRHSPEVGLGMR
jgi:hypothetical protein